MILITILFILFSIIMVELLVFGIALIRSTIKFKFHHGQSRDIEVESSVESATVEV